MTPRISGATRMAKPAARVSRDEAAAGWSGTAASAIEAAGG